MKQKIRLRECYALNTHKRKHHYIRYISLLAVLTSMCLYAQAQVPASKTAGPAALGDVQGKLYIGKLLPEEIWQTPLPVLHHPLSAVADTVTLADHRGKIIVLDFWATYCSSCLKSIPKLDSLQQAYPDRFFALLVNPKATRDNADKIRATLKDKLTSIRLPTLYEDTVLTPLFDIRGVPTLVWIDEYGGVLAITNRRGISSGFIENLFLNK